MSGHQDKTNFIEDCDPEKTSNSSSTSNSKTTTSGKISVGGPKYERILTCAGLHKIIRECTNWKPKDPIHGPCNSYSRLRLYGKYMVFYTFFKFYVLTLTPEKEIFLHMILQNLYCKFHLTFIYQFFTEP